MKKIAVFASGSGSNAENIVRFFSSNARVKIQLILTNNAKAGVSERARRLNIPIEVFSKKDLESSDRIINILETEQIDFIVLSGFLLLIPQNIIDRYRGRIINVHPALLPQHGGQGFYGSNVHRAVIESGAIMSGITIHHVNDKFDEGEIIFQAACYVGKEETQETLAGKIHTLEYSYFPVVIEKMIRTIFYNKSETA